MIYELDVYFPWSLDSDSPNLYSVENDHWNTNNNDIVYNGYNPDNYPEPIWNSQTKSYTFGTPKNAAFSGKILSINDFPAFKRCTDL
jgi:hypothetical protein